MKLGNVCYNCFQEREEGAVGGCLHCGYDPERDKEKYPLALPHGTVLNGRYITGRVLGQGGFGVTYVAKNWKTGQRVAIKEYLPDTMATRIEGHSVSAYSGDRGESFFYGKECFLKEAQTLAEFIGNPNIVRVHSYFEEYGTAYFVMDYVEGISFQEYIREHGGKIPWEEARNILLPVIDALAAVHERGIVHRDVTPDNIFITEDGTVKLLDFGAARYSLGDKSRSLDVVLKHGFAPKEQYTRHGRQGPYTDVYTVSASFYYALTGRKPPDSIDRLEEDDLVPPRSLGIDIPVEMEDAILKGLGVQPADRYQNMGEFKQALLQHQKEEPQGATGFQKEGQGRNWQQEETASRSSANIQIGKKKFGIIMGCAAGGTALIVLVICLAIFWRGSTETDKPTPTQEPAATSEPTPTQEPTATSEPTPTPEQETYTYSCGVSLEGIELKSGEEQGASLDTVENSGTFYVGDFIYCNFSCSKPGIIKSITWELYKEDGTLVDTKTEHAVSTYSSRRNWYATALLKLKQGNYYCEITPSDINGKVLESLKCDFTLLKKASSKKSGTSASRKKEYVLPDSARKYYSAATIKKLSAKKLRLARNEIYARHGYIFKDAGLKKYFEAKSWYKPKKKDVADSSLNKYEKANIKLLQKYEKKKKKK